MKKISRGAIIILISFFLFRLPIFIGGAAAQQQPDSQNQLQNDLSQASAAPAEANRNYNAEAIKFFQSGQLDKAFDRMYLAIKADPQNVEIRYNYALMLYKAGNRFVEAKRACEDVLAIKPDHMNSKVLLKDCISRILQGEGVKNDTSLATSKYLETEKQVHTKLDNLPDEIKTFLKLYYLDKNFEEAYVYLTAESKRVLSKPEFINHSKTALDDNITGVPKDVQVISLKNRDKELIGVAQFEVVYEKELKQPLKSALGDFERILEKKKNFMFYTKEGDNWVVIPPDFMIDRFVQFCAMFPETLGFVGTEIKLDADWRDSTLLELEKISEFLENKKPEEALKSRIMYNALAFLKARKDKDYAQMHELLAEAEKNLSGTQTKFIKNMMREDIRTVIREVKLHDIQVKSRIACVKFSMESFNNIGSEQLSINRLTSYLMVVKDGVNWRVVDIWRTKWFLNKHPEVYKEFNPGEDQYLEFNGRDWIDRSMEYNVMRREALAEIDDKY